MMIELKNDFHNATVRLHVRDGKLSVRQVRRSKQVLCGIAGCTCSDDLGRRGHQTVVVEVRRDGTAAMVYDVLADDMSCP